MVEKTNYNSRNKQAEDSDERNSLKNITPHRLYFHTGTPMMKIKFSDKAYFFFESHVFLYERHFIANESINQK